MDHHRHLRYALEVHGLKFDCSSKLQRNKPGNWDLPPAFQALLNFTRAHDKSTSRFFWRLIIKCHFCGDSVIWWNFNKIASVDCKLSKMVTNTQLNASLFWIHGERSNRACEIMEKTRGASDNFCWPDTGGCSLVFQERNGTQMSFVRTAEDKEMLVLRSKACSWTWQAQQGSPYLLHHPRGPKSQPHSSKQTATGPAPHTHRLRLWAARRFQHLNAQRGRCSVGMRQRWQRSSPLCTVLLSCIARCPLLAVEHAVK